MREDLKLERRMRVILMNQNQSTTGRVEKEEKAEKMEKNREDLNEASLESVDAADVYDASCDADAGRETSSGECGHNDSRFHAVG